MTDPIYLDHNATTPIAEEVFAAMAPWLREHHGNPSSSHAYGKRAAQAVATARAQVAALIGAHPDEIVFTGCATEANNLAVLGVARAIGTSKRRIVISAVEHPYASGQVILTASAVPRKNLRKPPTSDAAATRRCGWPGASAAAPARPSGTRRGHAH